MTESDLRYLRYAIMIAERARQHGSPPFGAVLVSSRGWILSEGENTQGVTADCTCHAETNLLHEATRRYSRALLAHSTMYTSAEPCPMCAGAIFWSGVGRVVFGLSSEHLYALTQIRRSIYSSIAPMCLPRELIRSKCAGRCSRTKPNRYLVKI
jgi:tRNA(Arg) A34 adenosine deaminase TadA